MKILNILGNNMKIFENFEDFCQSINSKYRWINVGWPQSTFCENRRRNGCLRKERKNNFMRHISFMQKNSDENMKNKYRSKIYGMYKNIID